jgi:DNA-binding transcriptional ArsR family regulator
VVRAARGDEGSRHLTLDATFAALADPTRRAVVTMLRRRPHRAGELADELGTTPAGLSRHLRVLRESGLVAEEIDDDDARVRVLRLERAQFEALRHWVEEVESFWTGQLASFKAHAERTRGKRSR